VARRSLPVLLLTVVLSATLCGCPSTPDQPEPDPKNGTGPANTKGGGTGTSATGGAEETPAESKSPDGFSVYSPEWSGTFFQDMFIFFGGERPPGRALQKIRETHDLTDWTYRAGVEDAIETTREGVQELARSDYHSWDETALVISLLSTMAVRDPAALVRSDTLSTLNWFRRWIHEDTIRMGKGVVTTEDDVIEALKALDRLQNDPAATTDPRRVMAMIDAISILGSHPWDELTSERPAIIKTTLSRPRGVIGRLTRPDLTARRGIPEIRDTLDRALLRVADEVIILTMMAAMADRTAYVRASAAKTLFLARDPRAVGPIVSTLGVETRDFVRLELVKALGASALGTARKRAIPALADVLMDTDISVRQAAASELERLTGAGIGSDVSAWHRWWKKHEKEYGRR